MSPTTIGIIDFGTNSIHLLVGVLGRTGAFRVIRAERELVRLGDATPPPGGGDGKARGGPPPARGGLATGRLSRQAQRRALRGLARYASMLRRLNVQRVEAVATSAVRDSSNGRAFARRVRAQLGIPLRVLSGREEARLAYLGVRHRQRWHGPVAVIAIGGGSAQVAHGDGACPRYATSVPLGGSRLAQQFIRHDPPRPEEVEALRRAAQRVWRPVVWALSRARWRRALGGSAMIYQLMMASHLRRYRRLPASKDRLAISQRSLRELAAWLSVSTAAERTHLPGLDPKRQDLALPTAVALLAWMEGCGVPLLAYAPGSIREGLAVDYLLRHHQGRTRRIPHPLEALFGANGSRGSARSRVRRRVVRRLHPAWSAP